MPRTAQPKDPRLLSKVSRLYHEQGLTELEVATRLHLSRSKVSRLLKQARREGIVRITVLSPPGLFPELEDGLERTYGLQEAVVIEATEPASQQAVSQQIGTAAARYLQETLSDGEVIGVCWGNTLRAMVAALEPQKTRNVHVVQINGGLGPPTSETHATDLCRRMATALGSQLTLLPAPGIMATREARQAILSDPHVRSALDLIGQVTVAYVGMGVPSPTSILMRDGSIMSQEELAALLEAGAVGDIALRFFDAQGRPIGSELDERVIGITLEQLKAIRRVVGVAGGPEKDAIIRGALLGRYINVLITDHGTARRLLAGAGQQPDAGGRAPITHHASSC